MRIETVHLKSKFKNLENFKIDIAEEAMETVLIGLNATGKSNFLELLVIIFRDLDLERPPKPEHPQPIFDYYIKYKCKDNNVEVSYSQKDGYIFIINWEKLKKKSDFFNNKSNYLPKHVFIYYSGISNRVKDLYSVHEKDYYLDIIKPEASIRKFDTIRPIFLVKNIHASFALIAFYMFRDTEEETMKFLEEELNIHDFSSALFILKKPSWAKPGKTSSELWWAGWLVQRFINDLLKYALAPISTKVEVHTNYKAKETQERLYLYLKDRETFQSLVDEKYNSDKIQLFNALESIDLSDLLCDVRIKVLKKGVNDELSMDELSEGEKQLLTVLGLLKFTKQEESLILLDEPDTHLNPLWKWKYLDFIGKVVQKHNTTQVIFCTHDPLVIGNMDKSQVQLFKRDPNTGKTYAEMSEVNPKGLGVARILTSPIFGLPTILDKNTQEKLNKKRYLQGRLMRNDLNAEEEKEYQVLKNELEEFGFYEDVEDTWFKKYLEEMSKHKIFQQVEFTDEEIKFLNAESESVVKRILENNLNVWDL